MDCGLGGIAEDRLADPTRIDGVEIKVQLRDDADIGPALPVDWNEGLDTELKFVASPDEPGLMVPVVSVPEVKVFETGVWKVASTSGIKRLMKSGRPRSMTALLR